MSIKKGKQSVNIVVCVELVVDSPQQPALLLWLSLFYSIYICASTSAFTLTLLASAVYLGAGCFFPTDLITCIHENETE